MSMPRPPRRDRALVRAPAVRVRARPQGVEGVQEGGHNNLMEKPGYFEALDEFYEQYVKA